MIEIINDFTNNLETDELIHYYQNNILNEVIKADKIYSFKYISLDKNLYKSFQISKKLNLNNSVTIRIQLIDNEIQVNNNTHRHNISWTYLLFLNDDFDYGELILENVTIKPKKNQLIIFDGSIYHKVNQSNQKRYSLVSFSDEKINFKKNIFI